MTRDEAVVIVANEVLRRAIYRLDPIWCLEINGQAWNAVVDYIYRNHLPDPIPDMPAPGSCMQAVAILNTTEAP